MAVFRNCPKCGAAIQPTDLLCMECGADIVAEKKRLEEEARRTKPQSFGRSRSSGMENLAARGVVIAGESSDLTRMRGFDKQEADKMRKELPTAYATAAVALFLGGALAVAAFSGLRKAGLEGVKALSPSHVRDLGWGFLGDPAASGVWYLALSLALLLCFVGQLIRGIRLGHSIALVQAKQKPEIVGISAATKFGILLLAIACPPLGVMIGIILMAGKDPESKALGTMTLWAGVIFFVLIIANVVWGLASAKLRPAAKPGGSSSEPSTQALWYAISVGLVWCRRAQGRREEASGDDR